MYLLIIVYEYIICCKHYTIDYALISQYCNQLCKHSAFPRILVKIQPTNVYNWNKYGQKVMEKEGIAFKLNFILRQYFNLFCHHCFNKFVRCFVFC